MASTYSTNLKIELQATGENSGTWGTITNTNLGTALEQAIVGYGNPNYASDANLTLTYTDTNAAQAARALVLNVTSGVSLTSTRELVVPTIQKQYIVQNNTTGAQSITVKTSAGTGITVPNGRKAHLYVDGTNVIYMDDYVDINGGAIDGTPIGANSASTGAFTTLSASGNITVSGGTANGVLYLDSSKVATSGSAVTYNGTTFATTGAANFATSSGNVGIGTASPQSKLNVVESSSSTSIGGSTAVLQVGNSYGAALNVSAGIELFGSGAPSSGLNNRSAGLYGVYEAYNAGGNAGALVLATNPAGTTSVVERMRIDSSGNVGIGTASPVAKLDIISGTARVYISNQSSTGFITAVNTTNTAYTPLAVNGSEMILKTGDAERMRIDSSGNVGIGANTSNQKATIWTGGTLPSTIANCQLLVGDTTGFANAGLALTTAAGNGSAIFFGSTATPTLGRITYDNTNNYMELFTNSSARMRIDSSGNVGIGGTAGADTKVNVLGTLPTSSNFSFGYRSGGTVPSGTTSLYAGFYSEGTTQATSFTLTNYQHFRVWQNGFGAGSTVTNQYGYYVDSNMTSATNNYGFYSNIASGSNRWNFYAAGTAINYFAGNTGIGVNVGTGNIRLFVKGENQTAGQYTIAAQDGSGNNTFLVENNGKVSDKYGNIRAIPQSGSDKTTSYTLATTDVGQFIGVGSGGSITVPDATFATGDVVSIFNNTTGNVTLTMSITTAYIGGTNTDKATITLATRGVATILFISGTVCVVNGNVT